MLSKLGKTSPVNPSAITSWPGGLNTIQGLLSPSQVESVNDCCDVYFDRDGTICTRSEIQPFSTAGAPGGIHNSLSWESRFGVSNVIWRDDVGILKYIPNGPGTPQVFPTQFAAAGTCKLAYFQVHEKLFLSNGVQVLMWDGATVVDVTTTSFHEGVSTPFVDPTDVTSQGVPGFCGAEIWHAVVWLVSPNVNTNVVNHDDDLWFSAALKTRSNIQNGERDYSNGNVVTLKSNIDHDKIIALSACGSSLFAFKNRSIHQVNPLSQSIGGAVSNASSPISFVGKLVSSDVGIAGQYAHSCYAGSTIFYDACKGLFSLDSNGGLNLLTTNIQNIVDEVQAPDLAAVGSYRNKIYLSVALENKIHNDTTFVYDVQTKTWSKYCRGFDQFFEYKPDNGDCLTISVASIPCPSLILLDQHERLETVDDYGCNKYPYLPSIQLGFTDFGNDQVFKNPVCTTFSFESLDAYLRITSHIDWDYKNVINTHVTLSGNKTPCYYGGGQVCLAHNMIEILNSTTNRNVADCSTMNFQFVKGITNVNIKDKCSYVSMAHTIHGIEGHWCLRKQSTLYKVGRFRF
jgi:hypothetical protein